MTPSLTRFHARPHPPIVIDKLESASLHLAGQPSKLKRRPSTWLANLPVYTRTLDLHSTYTRLSLDTSFPAACTRVSGSTRSRQAEPRRHHAAHGEPTD